MDDKILKAHYATLRTQSLKSFFKDDSRFDKFSLEVNGLFVDYSKNWINTETMALLNQLAIEKKLPQAISALFSGKKINISEDRAALHWMLRLPQSTETVERMDNLAKKMESRTLLGFTGRPIETLLHIGVGGSGLGPKLYYDALRQYPKKITSHFLIHLDLPQIEATLRDCDPETTLAIVVSKSFATPETTAIFNTVASWYSDPMALKKQCIAVTAKAERAIARGFSADNIFLFDDAVGGRYSVWSAVNLVNVLTYGIQHFKAFLKGAHAMDRHFQTTPLEKNLPVILGLLAFWYNNFFHVYSKAIVPYSTSLTMLPNYLQQLYMESLGKNVNLKGEKIGIPTGQVIWGDVGPASQHSFHQLLMQGTQFIPVEFILPFEQDVLTDYDKKRAAYCLSQSETLLNGCEGDAYQKIEGDRPSTTIVIRHFSPETFGALLALYEHRVYVQSVMWGINAFDQWGVERGKKVADSLLTQGLSDQMDGSTKGLFARVFQND